MSHTGASAGLNLSLKGCMFKTANFRRSYIVLWIALSAIVIMLNKYVLAYSGFPYPISLTLTHMAFCATLAFGLIKAGVSDTAHMDSATYMRFVACPNCAWRIRGVRSCDLSTCMQVCCSHCRVVRRHPLDGKRCLSLPQRCLHPDDQGRPSLAIPHILILQPLIWRSETLDLLAA